MPPKASKTPGPSQSLLRPVIQSASTPPCEAAASPEGSAALLVQDIATLKSELILAVKEELQAAMEEFRSRMEDLRIELKRDLQEFSKCLREDMKKQMDEFTSEMRIKLQDVTSRIEGVTERVGEMEHSMADAERWDIAVKDTLTQLIANQRTLQDKVTEMEGHARRNNIRIYGIPEDAEGTSATAFVVNMIKTQLSEDIDPNWSSDLGIERAHRALAVKPSASAPPRSMVVRFLQFTVKEKILYAAWKKGLSHDNQRVYFDHDYAGAVQKKRREYAPIKKALKEQGIRFRTPMTKMRVHLQDGPVTYHNATQAAEDLRRRGLNVGKITCKENVDVFTEETLAKLLPWEVISKPRSIGEEHQQQVRERLQEYRRKEASGVENQPPD
uniref:L1 transposable element RRM domain-containing protein n=1 Tax=Pygocentrus nattereri TaxID=42514 RepID=A0AAR2IRW6_PYGNA